MGAASLPTRFGIRHYHHRSAFPSASGGLVSAGRIAPHSLGSVLSSPVGVFLRHQNLCRGIGRSIAPTFDLGSRIIVIGQRPVGMETCATRRSMSAAAVPLSTWDSYSRHRWAIPLWHGIMPSCPRPMIAHQPQRRFHSMLGSVETWNRHLKGAESAGNIVFGLVPVA
jgi:hypothetical protein